MSTEAKSFLTSYHNYDDILVWMKELVLAHSDIATLVEVGKTYEGRTIYGIAKMHTPNTPDSESTAPLGFIFHGAQHAREWISAAVSIYLLDSLVATLSSETMPETVADLALTKFEWTVIPVMNVDGYIYTWEKDRMWRKNRQPNPSSSFFPCVGTDTNRNWDYRWNTGGSSRNPCSEAYLGPSPFSSQEPKAIADYVLSRKKAGVDVKVYIDFHAYSQLWMSPWGYTCSDDTVDENRQVAAAQKAVKALAEVNGKRFAAGPICRTIYPASGSSTDWVYGTANVTYSYGVELRDTGAHGFVLPASEILPSGKEMWAAVTALAEFVAKDANVVQ
ncbi:peptidase M14, carboxypeptidase A [Gonapodya prolifera JEL478]|uniref:Carboxypeptidase M14A n=1 Tax=Gonapodya prolifera (strain JEL478) TaxID=1344416 RepID=A0A139AW08_GONPJ|nr:peptidase M14, carboxypeptidase A [Gonapodya prolifera JEL478]|eukprot:KXS20897.1 peptidase M14, carboxypeptidase A [Gonapodya prolifera JEL478]